MVATVADNLSDARREESFWVFGYGSLVWRPAFSHLRRRSAYIEGWARRFWQGSVDHRGIPGQPGRVVTLVREPDSCCWGMAYEVASSERATVLDTLDRREQGGYSHQRERLHFPDARAPIVGPEALVYVASPSNPNYLGPAGLDEIAAQVRGAAGPSGSNLEYVLRLAAALREMGATDEHVLALEAILQDRGS